MRKILFVCHGNICRSPMAEMIMKSLVKENNLQDQFHIESRAMSREEVGNAIYPPAKKKLQEKLVPVSHHQAKQITSNDLETFDEIYLMDSNNYRWFKNMFDENPKVHMFLDYDVADPWYSGDFETTYQDCFKGCEKILKKTNKNN